MNETSFLILIADLILGFHVLFVMFVVFGLALIYVGHFKKWHWIKNPWFRIMHVLAICVVVIQSWFGIICPLTIWEMALRKKAGSTTYEGSFIQHWLQSILYYDAPEWVFITAYTMFGVLVVASLFLVRANKIHYKK